MLHTVHFFLLVVSFKQWMKSTSSNLVSAPDRRACQWASNGACLPAGGLEFAGRRCFDAAVTSADTAVSQDHAPAMTPLAGSTTSSCSVLGWNSHPAMFMKEFQLLTSEKTDTQVIILCYSNTIAYKLAANSATVNRSYKEYCQLRKMLQLGINDNKKAQRFSYHAEFIY